MEVERVRGNNGYVVRLSGTINVVTSSDLREQLQEVVALEEKLVVVTLKDVDFLDSSGIATLVEFLQGVLKYGGQLRLAGLQELVREMFELARLDSIFDIFDSEELALGA